MFNVARGLGDDTPERRERPGGPDSALRPSAPHSARGRYNKHPGSFPGSTPSATSGTTASVGDFRIATFLSHLDEGGETHVQLRRLTRG